MAGKKRQNDESPEASATSAKQNPAAMFAPLEVSDVSKLSHDERARLTQFAPVLTAKDKEPSE